jgi:hydroxyacylglutathione hydrolase
VLDTRSRDAFFEGHLAASLLTDLDVQFCSVAGSYVPESTPIYLVVDETRLDEAVRALVRVGLDRVVGYVTPEELAEYGRQRGSLCRTTTIDMAELEKQRTGECAHPLDVRGAAEFDAGHVPGALNVPHTHIAAGADTLPVDKPLLVYCASGARAAAAVAMLSRLGFDAIAVNDSFANYRRVQPLPAGVITR